MYYYQPREFLCSGTDAPMCSLLHLLHVPCSAMYKCFGVWLCLPVHCYGPLFSWSIQLPLGFVCSAHVGGHNPGTLGGVGLVVSWHTRVRKSSSSSSWVLTFWAGATFWDMLYDFVGVGMCNPAWVQDVGPARPFLHVVTDAQGEGHLQVNRPQQQLPLQ